MIMCFINWIHSLLINLFLNVIKCGPIPKHVAIIMDGNRRYGVENHITLNNAYINGFKTLENTIEWCHLIGIQELTVYAFSIDNFKRTTEEVTLLMRLFEHNFTKFLDKDSLIMKNKIRVRIFGKISLLPIEVEVPAAKLVLATKDHNDSVVLNICLAYSGREEIANAMRTIVKGVREKSISENQIDRKLLSQCLYSNESGSDPDVLIRTSGETRLSDFLLWQTSCTSFHVVDILWPDWNLWCLFKVLLNYQNCFATIRSVKKSFNIDYSSNSQSINSFISHVNNNRFQQLKQIALLK